MTTLTAHTPPRTIHSTTVQIRASDAIKWDLSTSYHNNLHDALIDASEPKFLRKFNERGYDWSDIVPTSFAVEPWAGQFVITLKYYLR